MALTSQQQIPKRPEEKQEWTFRRLFGLGGAATAVSKVFTNPFDVLLGYLLLIAGVVELLGRHVSWFFWVIIILILFVDLLERRRDVVEPKKTKEEKK